MSDNDKLAVPLKEIPVTGNTLNLLLSTPTVPARYKESPTGFQDMLSAVLTGREIGLGPLTSIYEIYLVNGQASMSGKAMLALVWRAGHKITVDIEETKSTVHCSRLINGEHIHVGDVEFTVEDAARAGLMEKGTYQSYPKTMLTWRAVSMACRIYYPDLLLGVGYVPEEVGVEAPVDEVPMNVVVEGEELLEMDRAMIAMEGVLEVEVVVDAEA